MAAPLVSRPAAALSGVIAAGVGMAVGHLAAALTDPARSPVLAVGAEVIDRTPTPLKDWAIRTFGTADKAVLLGSVTVMTVVLAAAVGLLARRRLRWGLAGLMLLVALAAAAVLRRPGAGVSWLLPTALTLIVGVVALLGLLALAGHPTAGAVVSRVRRRGGGAGTAAPSRRAFVAAAGAASVVGAGGALAGVRLSSAEDTSGLALPRARQPAPGIPAGLEAQVRDLTPLRTPNAKFYRVDTALTVPSLDRDRWRLRIDGDVAHPITLSYNEIARMDLIERNITMTCVSNEVGGSYAGGATWLGVRTRDLLRLAGVRAAGAERQVLSTSSDGFTISTPLEAMLDDRDALLAIGMNGKALPREHGYPARLVTPGLYGMLGSTKWVTRLTVTTYAAKRAYWTQRGWTTNGPVKPSARIDLPRGLAQLDRGIVTIGGIAWAQRHGVVGVQVSIDDGPWVAATLGPSVNVDFWRQWIHRWDARKAAPGQHSVRARVVYGEGQVQSSARAGVFPSGSSGIQEQIFFLR
ncbi:molybdopterin-dependent oxidoreductase [Calidifontibacter sp. DB0510]|uniref:Molybdopterin-dependent oxidoreductase n=1 Tax=Metallococcus carri TaxID=1656884 RepID=A0A967AY24_9MICO|nr:molybdopterin-dependent oxidoreductase [Metallococcus carri]NHN55101.1 molybdopterin-dependent oxidoreductase [Metallococcus carri]NOP36178.1 molybdopterin-dependent oxidoreductase [Calidifontibacter sp. DB2511S]